MNDSPNKTEVFDLEYYRTHCGDLPYLRTTPQWLEFFRPIADSIVLALAPQKVFDAGCAVGFLVEMLWDRGVETHGRDISEFAISQVRADVKPWCEVGSIADPIEGSYDLVLCIEVLEHMPPEEALSAIRHMTRAAPRILFSSSPTDLEEATHINVRPTRYWLERFAEAGFAPVPNFDATFLCPHAMLLERSEEGRDARSLAAFAEIVRQRLKVSDIRRKEAENRSNLQKSHAEHSEGLKEQIRHLEQRSGALAEQVEALHRNESEARDAARRAMTTLSAEKQSLARKNAEIARAEACIRSLQSAVDALARQAAPSPAPMLLQPPPASPARLVRPLQLRLPGRQSQAVRGTAKLLWWISTMQLPNKALSWRRNQRAMRAIRQSGLFDETYYRAHNPDVVASNIDPLWHFVVHGGKEGRKPCPAFDSAFYLAQNPDVSAAGINPLVHYLRFGRQEGRQPAPGDNAAASLRLAVPPASVSQHEHKPLTARTLMREHGAGWAPLPIFLDAQAAPTLTILTDSIDAERLFGGVGTALVVGAALAQRMGARLRVATRHAAPDPSVLGHVLEAHGIDWKGQTDFAHLPLLSTRPLSVGENDLILTTSWWSTRAALGSLNPSRILYLLQEDERMFYPYGDMRLLCAEILAHPSLRVLVNTRLLFDHLADGADPLPNLRQRGHWFEPAFPAIPRRRDLRPREEKQNFFFYARPHNDRNLYWRGLEVIDNAMREGVLSPDEWNIHFVGHQIAPMELPGGARPIVSARMPWKEYAALVARMDLGLCLMDTPHPSYPPLDLAAAGAVVVTNTHGPKTSLRQWSRNIISTPLGMDSLRDGLRQGVALSQNFEQRAANYAEDDIPRAWEPVLRPALDAILEKRG